MSIVTNTLSGPVLNPDYQTSNSITPTHYQQHANPKWEKHFWASSTTAALPVMFKKKPYWKLRPYKTNNSIISNFELIEQSVPLSELRPPTDKEYAKYFKTDVETKRFKLKSIDGQMHLFIQGKEGENHGKIKYSGVDKRAEFIRINNEEAKRLSKLNH